MYASYDNRDREKLRRGTGSNGKLISIINGLQLNVNSSTQVWCEFTNYEDGSSTMCNYYVYENGCETTGNTLLLTRH